LLAPQRWWDGVSVYLQGVEAAHQAQLDTERLAVTQAERIMRTDELELENARLRAILQLRPRLEVESLSAEVLYEAPDAFTRKVVIDRGSNHGVLLGSPVVDQLGVLGQVTRVYPRTSEVTLVIDKDSAVPVVNVRSRQRGVAYGTSQSQTMELRFMAGTSDVQDGDELQTSGLDGVYPAGLPVARVTRVDRRADSGFARIMLQPAAEPDNSRHVLLLKPRTTDPFGAVVVEAGASSAAVASAASASASASVSASAAVSGAAAQAASVPAAPGTPGRRTSP